MQALHIYFNVYFHLVDRRSLLLHFQVFVDPINLAIFFFNSLWTSTLQGFLPVLVNEKLDRLDIFKIAQRSLFFLSIDRLG